MITRVSTVDDLRRLHRELAGRLKGQTLVRVCSTGCRALGALDVCDALEKEIASRNLGQKVRVVRAGCHGLCAGAVTVVIDPKGIFYQGVTPADAAEIVEHTVIGGKTIARLCWSGGGKAIHRQKDIPFYKHQTRLVLRNCGAIDPTSLDDALARGAYQSVAAVLAGRSPEQVIHEVIGSGLRGRGGAGFPTGKKWQFCRNSPGEPKYVICNADEGDPGAFMDRALLEGDPHLVIEGMIIGAYAIGATHGVIYVRAEYPIAIEHTQRAIAQARELGLLGRNILASGFDFDIEIRKGAGAFVCGEETSLIASVEGKRGMPRPRPPFPAVSGLYHKPTNINNVETWANVPRVVELGAARYAAIGTKNSTGTKIFALAGKVNNTGLVEVPMGATLRQIVGEIGGGIPRGRKFKAAQMGGPSGGCVPAQYLDLPIDYESVKDIGAIMGSGGLIIVDESTCMVDLARFFTDFVQKESCGKCVPCRVGTREMLDILTRITSGHGTSDDLDRLQSLGQMIRQASLCGLGQTAPNPVLSTLRYFRDEYQAHIRLKRCTAHACKALAPVTCSSACPAHVNVPQYLALTAAGRLADALEVVRRRNPLPSVCGRACDHPCERFCRRGDVDQPVAIRHVKRFLSDHVRRPHDPPVFRGPRSGKVAVVGAGPAGLTAAYFLALMGREVTVYEQADHVGGVLSGGIPAYRLPRAAIQRDVDYIRRCGVEIKTNHRVESLQELREQGCAAIFLSVGAPKSVELGIPGEHSDRVRDAMRFLREVNEGQLTRLTGRVAVIGGGNAAIDSARTALRLGADSVTLLYRRGLEEMPAIREEIEEAMLEGVDMRFLVAPQAVEDADGGSCVRCVEMELGPADESGRRRPVPKPGSESRIPADHVIVAIGQGPDLEFAASDQAVVVSRGRAAADPLSQRVGQGDVFAGGDAVTGPSTIIEAIAAGQRAAQAIDVFLGGSGELPPDTLGAPAGRGDQADQAAARHPIRTIPARGRKGFEEVLKGFSEQVARCESGRCLRCDLE